VRLTLAWLFALSLLALELPSLAADEAECKARWEAVDANKDGSVDATEGEAHFDAIAASDANFDADGDGKLTTEEFAEACKVDAFKDIE
jgi:hypothetical protein